jgi:hypothetical protein
MEVAFGDHAIAHRNGDAIDDFGARECQQGECQQGREPGAGGQGPGAGGRGPGAG